MAAHLLNFDSNAEPQERRRRKRSSLHCPIGLFRRSGAVLRSTTVNLSSGGFYCLVPVRLIPGEELEGHITIPAAQNSRERLTVICHCTVTRIESLPENGYGLACRVDDYSVTQEAESSQR
jgi:hypothetical protein